MYFKFFISFKGEPHRGLPIFMTEPPSVTAYSGQISNHRNHPRDYFILLPKFS